jgi:hypothetical protein
MAKPERTYDPSLARFSLVSYSLGALGAPDDRLVIELGGAFFLSHIKCSDQGGTALGVQMKIDEGDEFHTVNGDVLKSGIGFNKLSLRNTAAVARAGTFMISHDPEFAFFNIYNAIVR